MLSDSVGSNRPSGRLATAIAGLPFLFSVLSLMVDRLTQNVKYEFVAIFLDLYHTTQSIVFGQGTRSARSEFFSDQGNQRDPRLMSHHSLK
jgi:hypothetical protein